MSEVLLVRHCRAAGQAPESPLTKAGQAQARALAVRLSEFGVERIVSSPFRRARESATPLADRLDLKVNVDERLIEHRLSDPPVDDWRPWLQKAFTHPHLKAPGGESGAQSTARGWEAMDAALACPEQRVVLVSHGALISLIIHRLDPHFGFPGWASLKCPDGFCISQPREKDFRVERLQLDDAS